MALNVAPIFLRLALGFVFVYAGAGKLFYTMPVEGHAAATLANLGLIKAPTGAGASPAETGDSKPEAVPESAEEGDGASDAASPPEDEADEGGDTGDAGSAMLKGGGYAVILAQDDGAEPRYLAEDYPTKVYVKRRLELALLINGAAESGDWPSALATPGPWGTLSLMTYAAALTEFVGGWLIILGFLTRIWSLGFAVTMLVAIWLTQIAPSIGAEGSLFGFLPELRISDAAAWTEAWQNLQFQIVILAGSLALMLTGPGMASLDAILFRRRGKDGPDDID